MSVHSTWWNMVIVVMAHGPWHLLVVVMSHRYSSDGTWHMVDGYASGNTWTVQKVSKSKQNVGTKNWFRYFINM